MERGDGWWRQQCKNQFKMKQKNKHESRPTSQRTWGNSKKRTIVDLSSSSVIIKVLYL